MKSIRLLMALFCVFNLQASDAAAQADLLGLNPGKETGFMAMAAGQAKYGNKGQQKATNSFFMVRPIEGSDFSLGATIFSSKLSGSTPLNNTLPNGDSSQGIRIDNISHVAYGTIFGYTWSSESFFGFQAWGGTGYMSNQLELESQNITTYREVAGKVSFCSGETNGKTETVYSIPTFIGVGVTIKGFGLFIQSFNQKISDVETDVTFTQTCSPIVEGETAKSTFTDEHKVGLAASFSMVTTGIHYRF